MSDFLRAIEAPYERFNFRDAFLAERPLLAHYTTIRTAEAIIANNQIWFSNPLFMNDIEELRFGVQAGHDIIASSKSLAAALADPAIRAKFDHAYEFYTRELDEKLALDIYVFCLSKHSADDTDGSLAMWRGYGAQGDGVAIVFDSAQLLEDDDGTLPSVLFAAPIVYGTAAFRLGKLEELVDAFADILRTHPPTADEVHHAAFHLHHCIVLQSLLMKHSCFAEEAEWRLIYMKAWDDEGELSGDIGYHIDDQGFAEPKLKFQIRAVKGMKRDSLHVRDLIHSFVVGPAGAGPLSFATFRRIVELRLGPDVAAKVKASSIPFRPRVDRA